MRAGDLASFHPTVSLDSRAIDAARLLASADLPGLIVTDDYGRPCTVLAGTAVLQLAVPNYYLEDPALARVVDEAAADVFLGALGDRTVRECLPPAPRELAVVDLSATVLEMAALMARTRTPLVAVVDRDELVGAVTLDRLLESALAT